MSSVSRFDMRPLQREINNVNGSDSKERRKEYRRLTNIETEQYTTIKAGKSIEHTIKTVSPNVMRKMRNICRFCPNRTASKTLKKTCKKHRLSRFKGQTFECNFCDKHFHFKSSAVAHSRAAHLKLTALEEMSKRTINGMLPNINQFQSVWSKYSSIR